ncbi:MAG: hypothetical protein ABDI19_04555 [Armatimonadota bacterium]
MKQQRVYLRVDGRVVGVLEGRTLRRRFKASVHMLQRPPALCLDARLYDAYRSQFDALVFTDEDSGRMYHIDAAHFDRHCFVIQHGGYPPQYACPLRYWAVHDPKAPQEQLCLWQL